MSLIRARGEHEQKERHSKTRSQALNPTFTVMAATLGLIVTVLQRITE